MKGLCVPSLKSCDWGNTFPLHFQMTCVWTQVKCWRASFPNHSVSRRLQHLPSMQKTYVLCNSNIFAFLSFMYLPEGASQLFSIWRRGCPLKQRGWPGGLTGNTSHIWGCGECVTAMLISSLTATAVFFIEILQKYNTSSEHWHKWFIVWLFMEPGAFISNQSQGKKIIMFWSTCT